MKRSLREKLGDLVWAGASNRELAFGIAVGVFVSFSPFFGCQMFICLALVLLFKRLNKPAVFLGVQLSWIYPPLLFLDYVAGCLLLPGIAPSLGLSDFRLTGVSQMWDLIKGFFPVLLAGSLLAGAAGGVLAYLVAMVLLKKYRRKPRG